MHRVSVYKKRMPHGVNPRCGMQQYVSRYGLAVALRPDPVLGVEVFDLCFILIEDIASLELQRWRQHVVIRAELMV